MYKRQINSLTHPSSVLCQQFADEVYEKTDGMVQITVRAPGELSYSANDYLTAVGDGSIPVSYTHLIEFGYKFLKGIEERNSNNGVLTEGGEQ